MDEKRTRAPRILIVEDDARLVRALRYFLERRGIEVLEAGDGDSGLAAFNELLPDLLIIDNSLPNKIGYEVCREVRGGLGKSTPIVMVSAFMRVIGADDKDEADLVDFFLRKPFQLEQLWSTLESMRTDNGYARPRIRPESGPAVMPSLDGGLPSEGSCKQLPVVRLLAQALAAQATGILTLQEDRKRVRRLYLANGFPAFARSNLITESLLRYLLKTGDIDAETYRQHMPKMQEDRWRPGATLVREGVLPLARLNRAHRDLVEEIIEACFDWTEASFDYKPSQKPIEQAVIYDINPFRLVDHWLEKSFSANQLLDRCQLLLPGSLRPSAAAEGWHLLIEWVLAVDPGLEAVLIHGADSVVALDVANELRATRARLTQTLLLMGALELSLPDSGNVELVLNALTRTAPPEDANASSSGFAKIRPSSRSAIPAAKPAVYPGSAPKPKPNATAQTGESAEQLRRIYDVVLRDFRRIQEVSDSYEMLCVSRADPIDMIRRRYERFERFYRPENFQRLGDSKLYGLVVEIRQSLARAMADIEAITASSGTHGRPATGVSFGKSTSWFEPPSNNHPLAQILFNDGLTYLRLGDFVEADLHFRRAIEEAPNNGMFEAYTLWTAYLRANRSQESAVATRSALERLTERYPQEDTAFHFLAHIHRELGNLEQAVALYRKAAELNPDNRSARLFLKRLMGTEG